MKAKFATKILMGALMFTGAFALQAHAGQVSNLSNNSYGGSQSKQPTFTCDTSNPYLPKTVSTRTGRALFIWTTTLGDWDPLSRCQAVTDRLNNQAKKNGGTLRGLIFNVGTVNKQTVVCITSASQPRCNSSNLIFTMKPENAYNAGEVLDQLRDRIEGLASGRPVIESEANKGVDANLF